MNKKIDILIVDDRKENLIVLENLLENEKLNIVKAVSGEEALALTFDYNFAVILLDIEMPGMNGFETAEYLRGSEKTKNIPIIFVTAHKDENLVFKGYDSGAVDFISKPIEPKILNNKIKIFIEMFCQNRKLKEQSILLEQNILELKKAKEEAESANRVKSQFIANTSHELRTPLNAILGLSKMITKYNSDNLTEEQIEGIETIHKSGQRLLEIINDLLDLSKIEAGKMDVYFSAFNFNEMLDQLEKITNTLIGGKDIKFKIERDTNISDIIISDEKKLNQVLTNLLSNASKFTESGEIKLKTWIEEEKIYFEVSDTGIGIKEEDQNKLFMYFSQIDNTLSRGHTGTGLGLALSKKLIQLIEGDITFESEYGKGTNFKIHIPAKQERIEEEAKYKNNESGNFIQENKGKKILIAEDEETSVLTLKMMLQDNYYIIYAKDGEEAVEKCHEEEPDLILMDIMMPVMNGIDALKKIRESGINVNAIAVTGLAMKNEKESILSAGFQDYISKPVDESELYKKINQYIK